MPRHATRSTAESPPRAARGPSSSSGPRAPGAGDDAPVNPDVHDPLPPLPERPAPGRRHGQPTLTFRTGAGLDAWHARVDAVSRRLAAEREARIRAGRARPEDVDPFHGLV